MERRRPWRNSEPDTLSQLRWVPPESSQTTIVDRELEISARRSHAAKVSHQRRRDRFRTIVQTQVRDSCSIILDLMLSSPPKSIARVISWHHADCDPC